MRVQVTTMRLNGQPLSARNSDQQTAISGELTIEAELVGELATQVTVARLRPGGTTKSDELLAPLVDAKLTELSDDSFALTGVEVRGAARFAQAWYCKVHVWKPALSAGPSPLALQPAAGNPQTL
ncbi:hypothetical protein [Pararobbsia alpina]|uniref:Uncharacterized protein n=1 Tax=Pararobbsia alpina TaxID=621374 RepID=A0A6S7BMH3_9BURK|nr:hypothetical protein [Pararobbsia alpina]CAB3805844.1 hypothetical protein LMG28138_05722 [Pararobbsia alpina]